MFIPNQLFISRFRLGLLLILLLVVGLGAVPGEAWALLNDTIRLEAEAFKLSGFVVQKNSAASGGKMIGSSLEEGVYAEAVASFTGKNGYYNLKIHYFDESDGMSNFKLKIGSRWVDNWLACQDLNNAGTGSDNLVVRTVSQVKLKCNDQIKLYGFKDQGEYARIDCVEFSYLGDKITEETAAHTRDWDQVVAFKLDSEGFVRHWYTLGPLLAPMNKNLGNEKQARISLMAKLRNPGFLKSDQLQPITGSGDAWRMYAGGANVFVENYRFFHNLTISDYYGLTYLTVATDVKVKVRLWSTRGLTQLWCNGKLITQRKQASGTSLNFAEFELSLASGANQIIIREWDLAARNTPQLFGLQIINQQEQVGVSLPGGEAAKEFFEAQEWLYTVTSSAAGVLESATAPSQKVMVTMGEQQQLWPDDRNLFPIEAGAPFKVKLTAYLQENFIERQVELPNYYPYPPGIKLTALPEYRWEYLHLLSLREPNSIFGLIVRAVIGETSNNQNKILKRELARIDSRADCSDFYLAGILRLYHMGALTSAEEGLVKQTALNFRYWTDESGTDAMSMNSENHQLLFHTNQLLAGKLFPKDRFTRSGRMGKEQAQIGKKRVLTWLDKVEQAGFEEFLSNSYIPITMGGLLNLYDYADDPEISWRAAKLIDNILIQLAQHSFDGVTSGPQGRIYRNGVLYPRAGGTQGILSYVTNQVALCFNPWAAYLGASGYEIPAVDHWLQQPLEISYYQGGLEINLNKTADYYVTSVSLPSLAGDKKNQPGLAGRQEHLWEIGMKGGTRIFVNHPGAFYEASQSRPGYWNGNGILPTLQQKGSMIMEIFEIPDHYPVNFTHVYWPAAEFDREMSREAWIFAQKGTAYIGLWCSQPLEPAEDMLPGRELRANGRKTAWLAVAGSQKEWDTFEGFASYCQSLQPDFDSDLGELWFSGRDQMHWGGTK